MEYQYSVYLFIDGLQGQISVRQGQLNQCKIKCCQISFLVSLDTCAKLISLAFKKAKKEKIPSANVHLVFRIWASHNSGDVAKSQCYNVSLIV